MASIRARKSIYLILAAAALSAALPPSSLAKDKQPVLPAYILQAETVAVLIDPDAGISLSDPNANQTARRDVEAALLKWGRFQTVLDPVNADIVIVLRKGTGKLVDTTINDPRQNRRPGSITDADDNMQIGAQHGPPPRDPGSFPRGPQMPMPGPHPQVETGAREDSFVVYEGHTDDPADNVPAWRYIHKNGLRSHDVPAVDEFRKAMQEAAKQTAANKPAHQKP